MFQKSLAIVLLIFLIVPTVAFATQNIIVIGEYVNLRNTPNTESDNVIRQLNYGEPLTILNSFWGEDGYFWHHVITNYDGIEGYIVSNYVGSESIGVAGITTTRVNLRSGPGTDTASYGVLNKYTIVKVLDASTEWYLVQYSNCLGYIKSDYLKTVTIESEELFGEYTTSFSTSQKGRCKNIQKGASLINECIIEPRNTFSLLNAIGPITKEGGYFEAPEYKKTSRGTQTVTGYGGGVCQLATTLYQSVCEAQRSGSNIKIIEHHHHSKSVSYIKDGEDATISWSSGHDFRFQNNNMYSIKIRTYFKDGTISCMIYRVA